MGTGESALPTFLSTRSQWNITCLDKCPWVASQQRFQKAIHGAQDTGKRFRVLVQDLLEADLVDEKFDLITCVSVIEHFEGNNDSAAMNIMGRLLRPGGTLILTTLVNEPFFAEFYLKRGVYGAEFRDQPVYYQRHYDVKSVDERLLRPSGLTERERVYFGDYGFQCFEKVLQTPKLLKALYAWTTPRLASRFLSYRPYPVGRKDMRMNTASGLIVVLEKTAAAN